MKSAVQAVQNKEMGSFKAARIFSVPQTILECYVKDPKKDFKEAVNSKLGRKPCLPSDVEKILHTTALSWSTGFLDCLGKMYAG
jgi:hypothetical protein